MTGLSLYAIYCFDVQVAPVTWYLLPFLVNICQHNKVVAHESDDGSCYPKCDINEFCCDGECCTYYARNWFAWTVLVALIFIVIITCLCLPRLPWINDDLESVHYQYVSSCNDYQLVDTKPYQQQPSAIPQYHSILAEEEHQRHQPYRYERLAQQNPPQFNYPAPSAPPKSP